jgi:Transposase DDE domain group 1
VTNLAGESNGEVLRLDFDRRLTLQFRGSAVTSDAGLLAYRELDDALGLSDLAGERLADARVGKNGRHALVGMLRQAVFGRLAGYEDVNDAERLRHDPAMRWIVGGKAAFGSAASASQMGRFETRWLTVEKNLSALADLSGQWVDRVHARRPPRGIVLDMDSSVSPTHGEQELSVWNRHYECTCYHPLFVFNQFGDLERCALRPGNVHSADEWEGVLKPVVARYRGKLSRIYFRADAGFANPEVYQYLEDEGIKYAIRLPANRVLQERIGYLLTRPVGRPPNEVRRSYANFTHQAGTWTRPRRVVPRSNGIRANFTRASASSSPTRRGRPRMSSPSTTSAGPASSGSRRARARSDGPGFPAVHSRPTPSVSCFMRSLTISATSCARWRRPSRSRIGR